MRIRTKIALLFLLIAIVPMLIIGVWGYCNGKRALEDTRLAELEVLADLKADKIEEFFKERKGDIITARDYFVIRENLPVVTELAPGPEKIDLHLVWPRFNKYARNIDPRG